MANTTYANPEKRMKTKKAEWAQEQAGKEENEYVFMSCSTFF